MTTHTRSLILFPHEIRAALAGALGLVVRPVKPQPDRDPGHDHVDFSDGVWRWWAGNHTLGLQHEARCPLGVPGNRLVCKETWAHDAPSLEDCRRRYEDLMGGLPTYGPYYFEDVEPDGHDKRGTWRGGLRWRSPATMPAWASRITLEVQGVRVCRTYELTGKDALACGFVPPSEDERGARDLANQFKGSWDRRYSKRGLGWDRNPWAWAVSVRRVEA